MSIVQRMFGRSLLTPWSQKRRRRLARAKARRKPESIRVEQLEDRRLLTAMPQSPVAVIRHDGPTVCTISFAPADEATFVASDDAAQAVSAIAAEANPPTLRLVEVSSASEFQDALDNALEGDEIVLAPGTYAGGFYVVGLTGVTIRSADPANRAVIDAAGYGEGFKLESATHVTIADLIFDNASSTGLHLDDGGHVQRSEYITLRNLGVAGNSWEGIKLTGVDHFHVDRVKVIGYRGWGTALNMIGSHFGLVERSYFENLSPAGGTGVQTKGGSSDITIRANRFVNTNERSIQIGGNTALSQFRPQPAGNVEASGVVVEGNLISHNGNSGQGIRSAVSFVNVADGTFRNNIVWRPSLYAIRILKENRNPGFLDTQSGVISDNIFFWYNNDLPLKVGGRAVPVNDGPYTLPETFTFERNQWYNASYPLDPSNSEPHLPAPETDGSYGVDPQIDFRGINPWQFTWGTWLVNASDLADTETLDPAQTFRLATPNEGARLDIGADNPLTGSWSLVPVTTPDYTVEPFTHAVLVNSTIPDPPDVVIGDAVVDEADGVAHFDVSLTASSTQDIILTLTTTDDSAVAPGDYSETTGQVTFLAGATSATFDVPIVDDPFDEDDEESFIVSVQSVDEGLVDNVTDTGTGVIQDDDVPPQVSSVEVSSVTEGDVTGWTSVFLNAVDPVDGTGYAIPQGPDQLDSLTWVNMNRIMVEFTKDVGSVSGTQVHLSGINLSDYSSLIDDVDYDSSTQRLTIALNAVLTADRLVLEIDDTVTDLDGNPLDGEWISGETTGTSGDERAGGDFRFGMNILPGDVNQEGTQQGRVNLFDSISTRSHQFEAVGDPTYSAIHDVDGNARINLFDVVKVRQRQFTSLPEAPLAAIDRAFLDDLAQPLVTEPTIPEGALNGDNVAGETSSEGLASRTVRLSGKSAGAWLC